MYGKGEKVAYEKERKKKKRVERYNGSTHETLFYIPVIPAMKVSFVSAQHQVTQGDFHVSIDQLLSFVTSYFAINPSINDPLTMMPSTIRLWVLLDCITCQLRNKYLQVT